MNNDELKILAQEIYEKYKNNNDDMYYAPSCAKSDVLFMFNQLNGFNQVKTRFSTVNEKLDLFENALAVDIIMFVLKYFIKKLFSI